jgi:hypothetical protein
MYNSFLKFTKSKIISLECEHDFYVLFTEIWYYGLCISVHIHSFHGVRRC